MLVFDEKKFAKEILKTGIKENDFYAKDKLYYVAKYLVCTKYRKKDIIKKMKSISNDYFVGFMDDVLNDTMQEIYNKAFQNVESNSSKKGIKTLILYKSEMEKIVSLDEKLQDLAFSFLVVNKFQSHYIKDGVICCFKFTNECNSDIYRIAKIQERTSNNTKAKMIQELVKQDIVKYKVICNYGYRYNRISKIGIAQAKYMVPFNVSAMDREEISKHEVWKYITNYDDILLYLRLYKNDPSVSTCAGCGCPIEITSNSKKYCSDCAAEKTKENKRKVKIKM